MVDMLPGPRRVRRASEDHINFGCTPDMSLEAVERPSGRGVGRKSVTSGLACEWKGLRRAGSVSRAVLVDWRSASALK